MRSLRFLAVLVVAGLASLLFWGLSNQPVPLKAPPGGKLRSVSFAPYRDGQSPLIAVYPSPAQIEEDLVTVAAQSASVRTYTSQEGLEILPGLARSHGVTITMGAWLSGDSVKNDREIAALIGLANAYPDVITRVIVGNEVLLRRELPVDKLIGYLDRARAAVRQPVSYADVWEWWMKFPELAGHVDYVTIHLLPYWEDVPASIDGAIGRVDGAYKAIAARFPGKPILVGEVGWPTAGRSRGPAVPGIVEMARFTNGLISLAQREGFDYNIIEAFDQNWKQALEGTVGGHWGLYTAARNAKFAVSGPVVADPGWPWKAAAATVTAAGLVFLAGGLGLAPGGLAVLTGLGVVLGTGWVLAAERVAGWAYYGPDVGLGALLLLLEAVLAFAVVLSARRVLAAATLPAEPARRTLAVFDGTFVETVGGGAALLLAAIAIVWTALLVFDGRYRGFPNPHFLIPGLGLPLLAVIRSARRPSGVPVGAAVAFAGLFRTGIPVPKAGRSCRLALAIAGCLLAGALGTVIAEGFVPLESILHGQQPFLTALAEVEWTRPNLMALGWAGLLVLLAVPFASAGAADQAAGRSEAG